MIKTVNRCGWKVEKYTFGKKYEHGVRWIGHTLYKRLRPDEAAQYWIRCPIVQGAWGAPYFMSEKGRELIYPGAIVCIELDPKNGRKTGHRRIFNDEHLFTRYFANLKGDPT